LNRKYFLLREMMNKDPRFAARKGGLLKITADLEGTQPLPGSLATLLSHTHNKLIMMGTRSFASSNYSEFAFSETFSLKIVPCHLNKWQVETRSICNFEKINRLLVN